MLPVSPRHLPPAPQSQLPLDRSEWPLPGKPEGPVTSAHPDVPAAAMLASTVGTSGYAVGTPGPGGGTRPQLWYVC
jgi:hypothetical protein